jgi:hypothetical protein
MDRRLKLAFGLVCKFRRCIDRLESLQIFTLHPHHVLLCSVKSLRISMEHHLHVLLCNVKTLQISTPNRLHVASFGLMVFYSRHFSATMILSTCLHLLSRLATRTMHGPNTQLENNMAVLRSVILLSKTK